MRGALKGSIQIPGDKSLSHRALIFSSLGQQPSRISGLLDSADVQATQRCLQQLGVTFVRDGAELRVMPPQHWQEPDDILNVDNSGTSIRLLSGLLAAQPFLSILTGDAAIRRRPMQRVIDPLNQMGAQLSGRNNNCLAPIVIQPGAGLHGFTYESPVASAQVKSAILLAGLSADSPVVFKEPGLSRDHTERVYQAVGVDLTTHTEGTLVLAPGQMRCFQEASGFDWSIPGDMSSAAFFIVAATLIPGSCLRLENVGLNPARTGLLKVMQALGANIRIEAECLVMGEPVGDLIVQSASIQGDITLEESDIPALVDEIPILMVAGLYLDGILRVRGAKELRAKESDRLAAMADALAALNIPIAMYPDGFDLVGQPDRKVKRPAQALEACHDHRIAMSLAVLNRVSDPDQNWPLNGREWVNISFPGFYHAFQTLAS